MTIVHSEMVLGCTKSGADKVYVLRLLEDGGTWQAVCHYGKRGARLSDAEYYNGPSRAAAIRHLNEKEEEKRRKKGYVDFTGTAGVLKDGTVISATAGVGHGVTATGASTSSSPPPSPAKPAAARESVAAGWMPQLLMPINPGGGSLRAEDLEENNDYCMQTKFDGERAVVVVEFGKVTCYNRTGVVTALPDNVAEVLARLWVDLTKPSPDVTPVVVLDGEMCKMQFVVFDMLHYKARELVEQPFVERYGILELAMNEILKPGDEPNVLLAPVYWSTDEKRDARVKLEAADAEGVVYRHMDSSYQAGARSSCDFKHKFWATCTCRVLDHNDKRSIQVGLRNTDGVVSFVGNVTVPVNVEVPAIGSLVEIRYLYCHDGGSLYQPTLIRERNDVSDVDKVADLRKPPAEKTK